MVRESRELDVARRHTRRERLDFLKQACSSLENCRLDSLWDSSELGLKGSDARLGIFRPFRCRVNEALLERKGLHLTDLVSLNCGAELLGYALVRVRGGKGAVADAGDICQQRSACDPDFEDMACVEHARSEAVISVVQGWVHLFSRG